jgi:hypothetical protein
MKPQACLRTFLFLGLLAVLPVISAAQRVHLVPRLRAGQTLVYHIVVGTTRNVTTQSYFVSPQIPPPAQRNFSGLLRIEVVEVNASGFRLKTYLSEPPQSSAGSTSPAQSSSPPSFDKSVDVFVARNGSTSQTKGFIDLSPSQQFAWSDWLASFTSQLAFPTSGLTAGQKWESVEPESAPSPITNLSWQKKYQYVRDEPCDTSGSSTNAGATEASPSPDICAAILIHATLRQKSSPKDSTPRDYKLKDLKTSGTASGQNETVLYFSRSSGLLVRSSEDAQQSMNVVIALADGSNQVHYDLRAKSRSEIRLLPDSPQDVR